MVRFLAYVDAVPEQLHPLVLTLLELTRRGHHVIVKAGVDDVDRLRTAGLEARSLASPVAWFEPDNRTKRSDGCTREFVARYSPVRSVQELARFIAPPPYLPPGPRAATVGVSLATRSRTGLTRRGSIEAA